MGKWEKQNTGKKNKRECIGCTPAVESSLTLGKCHGQPITADTRQRTHPPLQWIATKIHAKCITKDIYQKIPSEMDVAPPHKLLKEVKCNFLVIHIAKNGQI